jgi:hypothetical protein
MMKRTIVFIGFYVLACAGSGWAQGLSFKSAEFSLSVGHASFSDKSFTIGAPQSSTPIPGEMKLSSGTMYEARINFYTRNRIGAEALYGYQYGGVTFSTTNPARSFGIPLQVHTIGLNLLYYPFGDSNSTWRPFVTVGGGATIYRPSTGGQAAAKDPLQGNFDTFFETSRAYGMAGGGLKRPITNTIGFRADASFNLTRVPTFGLPESSATPSATVLPVGGLVHSVRASAGVIFYLGK